MNHLSPEIAARQDRVILFIQTVCFVRTIMMKQQPTLANDDADSGFR